MLIDIHTGASYQALVWLAGNTKLKWAYAWKWLHNYYYYVPFSLFHRNYQWAYCNISILNMDNIIQYALNFINIFCMQVWLLILLHAALIIVSNATAYMQANTTVTTGALTTNLKSHPTASSIAANITLHNKKNPNNAASISIFIGKYSWIEWLRVTQIIATNIIILYRCCLNWSGFSNWNSSNPCWITVSQRQQVMHKFDARYVL